MEWIDMDEDRDQWRALVNAVMNLLQWEGGVKSNWVHSALWPLLGILCLPVVIMVVEKLVE
jgi:hypothetical protein